MSCRLYWISETVAEESHPQPYRVDPPWTNIKLVDLFTLVGTGLSLVCCLVIRGSTGDFLLCQYFSGVVSQPRVLQLSQNVSVESSSLTHHRPYSRFVCSLCGFIDGLGKPSCGPLQKLGPGRGLDPVKLV